MALVFIKAFEVEEGRILEVEPNLPSTQPIHHQSNSNKWVLKILLNCKDFFPDFPKQN